MTTPTSGIEITPLVQYPTAEHLRALPKLCLPPTTTEWGVLGHLRGINGPTWNAVRGRVSLLFYLLHLHFKPFFYSS